MPEKCVLRHAVVRSRFKAAYTQELKVDRACSGLIIYQGVMPKVVLDFKKIQLG
jgi:hypothetical protein